MSDENTKNDEITVNIDEWVNKAKADPEAYIERQATEIFLTTLGTVEPYCRKFYLKGGILMGVVYDSPRQTADIDYSTAMDPDPDMVEHLKKTLTEAFPITSARLGYTDIVCSVQTVKLRPRAQNFSDLKAPGFEITVGYAKRESAQEERVLQGKAARVLHVDVSFKEPVGAIQIVKFSSTGTTISAYSLKDMISEKFRAFFQQEKRNRTRRQDIYDLSLLIKKFSFDEQERTDLMHLLIEKCEARDIYANSNSIDNEENIRRAKSEWESMALEVGDLPDFNECFQIVKQFYKTLPWEE